MTLFNSRSDNFFKESMEKLKQGGKDRINGNESYFDFFIHVLSILFKFSNISTFEHFTTDNLVIILSGHFKN